MHRLFVSDSPGVSAFDVPDPCEPVDEETKCADEREADHDDGDAVHGWVVGEAVDRSMKLGFVVCGSGAGALEGM